LRWRWGVQTAEDLLEVSRAFVVDPARIMCPLLILIGENEYHHNISSREWVEETVQKAGGVDTFQHLSKNKKP